MPWLLNLVLTGGKIDFTKLIKIAAIAVVAFAIWYLTNRVLNFIEDYNALKVEQAENKIQIAQFKQNMADVKANVEKQQKAFETVNTLLTQHANTLNKFRSKFSVEELTAMGLASPEQLRLKLEAEYKNRLRCIEILTGSPQTPYEVDKKFVEQVCR